LFDSLGHWAWAHGPPKTRPPGPRAHFCSLDGDRRSPHAPPELPWRPTGTRAPFAGVLPLRACSPCGRAPLAGVLLCGHSIPNAASLASLLCARAPRVRNAPRGAATMPRIRWAGIRQGGPHRNHRFKIDHFRELRNCADVSYSAQGTSQCNPGMPARRA